MASPPFLTLKPSIFGWSNHVKTPHFRTTTQLSHQTTPWLLHKGMRCTIDRSLEVSPVAMNRDGFSGFPLFILIFHGIFGLSIDHPAIYWGIPSH
jgi:hypothetical protein